MLVENMNGSDFIPTRSLGSITMLTIAVFWNCVVDKCRIPDLVNNKIKLPNFVFFRSLV